MKLALAGAIASLAAISLSACVDGGYGYSNTQYGYADRGGWYDGYYDNFYGPLYGGYWGPGSTFYYQSYRGGPYIVDRDRHFRHDHFDRSSHFRTRDYRNDHDRRQTYRGGRPH